MTEDPTPTDSQKSWLDRRTHRALRFLVGVVIVYFVVCYVLLPMLWKHHDKRHPALADAPRITHTKDGIHGDPLNIALVGSEESLHRGMLTAGWYPADPITLYVFTGANASFDLYEDENVNYNYTSGKYSTIPFSYDEEKERLRLVSARVHSME